MKKFYVTTPIYYVNDRPHIGHAYATIAADAVARFWRARLGEKNVWFLTGTDEHGAKIEKAAQKAGKTPQVFSDEVAGHFRAAWAKLDLSFNDFIRTTEPRHEKAVTVFMDKLKAVKTPKGSAAIYEGEYRGLYCTGHEAFLKGEDLIDGVCPDHRTKPELIKEKNWFFRLSDYQDVLADRIKTGEFEIAPDARRNEVLSFVTGGLEDIAISRPQVKWGIPVPFDRGQTIYVWVDALINYISAVGYSDDEIKFGKWWPADLHLVGKDIIKFHCVIWPALLLAAGLELPRKVFAHGFFTINGEKISKSLGNAIDPLDLVGIYGNDALRYFLFREIPFGGDGDFSEEKLRELYNGELANGIGNLVARVAALGEKISPVRFGAEDILPETKKEVEETSVRYEQLFRDIRLNEALADAWRLVSFADRYINDTKPWAATDPEKLRLIIANAVYVISALTNFLRPFIPQTAERIERQIAVHNSTAEIKKGEGLFPRLAA